jgi:hypothetical protein
MRMRAESARVGESPSTSVQAAAGSRGRGAGAVVGLGYLQAYLSL